MLPELVVLVALVSCAAGRQKSYPEGGAGGLSGYAMRGTAPPAGGGDATPGQGWASNSAAELQAAPWQGRASASAAELAAMIGRTSKAAAFLAQDAQVLSEELRRLDVTLHRHVAAGASDTASRVSSRPQNAGGLQAARLRALAAGRAGAGAWAAQEQQLAQGRSWQSMDTPVPAPASVLGTCPPSLRCKPQSAPRTTCSSTPRPRGQRRSQQSRPW
mmetsp:Transcript_33147/g.103378  ORF Transcript_33147/g.103378 Transcript_33147/m.103378 type:complete len:217 (-) Transcript_33147:297-947(-)